MPGTGRSIDFEIMQALKFPRMGKSDPDVTRRQPNPPPAKRPVDDTTAPAQRNPDDLTAPGPAAAAASVTSDTDTTALSPEQGPAPSPPIYRPTRKPAAGPAAPSKPARGRSS